MGKQVLIDQDLLTDLIRYHVLGVQDDPSMNVRISRSLEEKLNKMVARIEYAKNIGKEKNV